MNILGLTIAGSLLVIVVILFLSLIYDDNKAKRKFKKDVEELKVGNKYQMKESLLRSNNPFKVEPIFIVEIIDIKFNNKGEMYVKYRQLEPEYKGEPFSESFKEFIDFFYLIKQ